MQTRNKWFSLCVVSSVLSGLIICGGAAEEAAPRVGCGCGQGASGQSETPAPADAEKAIVCPQYVWMDWGTYCSYYAQVFELCDPVNLDHENCELPVGDCMTGTDCVGFAKAELLDGRTPLLGGKLGETGYGGDKVAKRSAGAPIPGSGQAVKVTKIDSFVIKFPVKGTPVYAQIFIAQVAPKAPSKSPPAVLARGLEISTEGLQVDKIRHDYTTAVPSGTHVHKQLPVPVKGKGREFLYHYGQLTIPIILHHQTPPHGE